MNEKKEPYLLMTDLSDIQHFYSQIQNNFSAPATTFELICTNSHSNFRTQSLVIRQFQDFFSGECKYRVLHCDRETLLTYLIPGQYPTINEVLDQFYSILWNFTLCPECFDLIEDTQTLCRRCTPMRIMYLWGIQQEKILSAPTCSICLDPVYFSKLSCGHFVHKTCFIRMNTHSWFDYQAPTLKCPVCRRIITSQDKSEFFMWYG